MQFVDSAKNTPEFRNCISYEVLKPIFEWLKRQKWCEVFLDAFLSEDYHSSAAETMISIRRSHKYGNSCHSVCCIIVYFPGEPSIHLENWSNYWNITESGELGIAGKLDPNKRYFNIPIEHPDMFKILKKYLVKLQNCLLLEQHEFTEDIEAATDERSGDE